jgi:hypothetical protein
MSTRSVLGLGVALALWLSTVAVAMAAPTVALFAGASGEVSWRASANDSWHKAMLLTKVPAGSQVKVAAGGSATLNMVAHAARWQLVGPVTANVSPDKVQAVGGGTVRRLEGHGTHTAMLLPAQVNIDQIAGVVRDVPLQTPRLLLLRDPAYESTRPTLHWKALGHFSSYRIEILDDTKSIFSSAALDGAQTSFTVPATASLRAGQKYEFRLYGHDDEQAANVEAAGNGESRILDAGAAKQVSQARQEAARTHDDAGLLALDTLYLKNGLNSAVLTLTLQLLERHPQDGNLWHLVSEVYRTRGELDQWQPANAKATQYGYRSEDVQ